jgi:hypothetical protein
MRSPLRDDHTTRSETGWTSRRYRIRAVWPGPQRRPHSPSARGGWGLVATRTSRSSHRPPSPRTQGPWGRARFRVLYAEVTAQYLDEAELVATTGPTNREVRRHGPAATPRRFARQPLAPGTTDPGRGPEGRRGSSAATTPGQCPPTTPAPRRWCQKARFNRTDVDHSDRLAHGLPCAAETVRYPHKTIRRRLRAAPGQ